MNDDFTAYQSLAEAGPIVVYRAARADGLDTPACFRLLRSMFELSLGDAKEVMIVADGAAESLDAHQRQIADAMERNGIG